MMQSSAHNGITFKVIQAFLGH